MKSVRRMNFVLAAVLTTATVVWTSPARAADAPQFKQYDAQYYRIYTDLDEDAVREATVRLMAIAEEYRARTKDFGGTINSKMVFRMFSKSSDYYAAGGLKGSVGQYNGKELMAQATPEMAGHLWHTVQHEGFHQFAHKVITPRLPIWCNEGMAEYFGEGVWTGEGLVTGVLPPGRIKRVQDMIKNKKLLNFDIMLSMSTDDWNKEMDYHNYDQAWSMVHFLVHAEDGKYRGAFVGFINDLARNGGLSPKDAWSRRFGNDHDAFQEKYVQWWNALSPDASAELYTQATAETMTAFLARGVYMKQKYESADDFFAACKAGKLAIDPKKDGRIWLPESLLKRELANAARLKTWSIQAPPKSLPRLILTLDDGTVFTGTFSLANDGVRDVRVAVTKPKPASSQTRPN